MRNIALAKMVFPEGAISACGVSGRPFSHNDLKALQSLGKNDTFFSWERTEKDDSYYANILNFRISHYEKYGFGVEGLWSNNQLIGQFGLQVLDEGLDRVEFAIFLGQDFRHSGLGSCLVDYLVTSCARVGLSEIYAVVRPDNPEGVGLLRRMKADDLGMVEHFQERARMYRVSVGRL
ncbi:GNAT family N-acetyltransferase (plasmid) [Paenarthrobacter ureafaciens]